jgi:hypothetical protein
MSCLVASRDDCEFWGVTTSETRTCARFFMTFFLDVLWMYGDKPESRDFFRLFGYYYQLKILKTTNLTI